MHSWILAYANTGLYVQIAARSPGISSDFGGPFFAHPHPLCQTVTCRTFSGLQQHGEGSPPASQHLPASSAPALLALEMPHSNLGTSHPAFAHKQAHAGERQGEQRELLIVCGGAGWQRIQSCVCSSCVTGMSPTAKSLAAGQAPSGRHLSLLGDLATPTCPNG